MTPEQLKASILQMAIQGKLVEQRSEEGTAEELYDQIQAEKQKLIKEGKIKKEKPLAEIVEDEIPFDIPESWKWVKLGDCTSYAQTKEKILPSEITPDMWSLDLEDIQKETGTILVKTMASERKIIGDKVKFHKNQVLYSKLRPYLKKILVAPDDGICTPELVPFDTYLIDQEYMVNVLRSPHIDHVINSVTYGVKMPRVGTDTMTNLLIPLPPLEEQHRIVAKIEELLPYVDRYAEAYEKLEQFNAKFPQDMRKSILQYAIQGKLVEHRPAEGTAEELYQQIQEEKQKLIKAGKIKKEKPLAEITEDEIPFDIPNTWKWVRVGNVFNVGTGMTPMKSNPLFYQNGTIPWVHSSLTSRRFIDNTDTLITEYALKNTSLKLYPEHTLIVAMYGQGKTRGQISELLISATINQACAALESYNYREETTKYVYYCFLYNYETLRKKAEGTSQPNLNVQKVKETLIPLPPLEEQHRIVAKIEELLPYCERLVG